jgi:hypothetical protein
VKNSEFFILVAISYQKAGLWIESDLWYELAANFELMGN